jgi:hypothetical protein
LIAPKRPPTLAKAGVSLDGAGAMRRRNNYARRLGTFLAAVIYRWRLSRALIWIMGFEAGAGCVRWTDEE